MPTIGSSASMPTPKYLGGPPETGHPNDQNVLVNQNVVVVDQNVVLVDQNVVLVNQNDALVNQNVVLVDQKDVLVEQNDLLVMGTRIIDFLTSFKDFEELSFVSVLPGIVFWRSVTRAIVAQNNGKTYI